MYKHVKSCVRQCNDYSDLIEYAVGLRQGEVISPALVSLFLEDIEMYLQEDINSGLSFFDIVLVLILFADDMAVLSETPASLQSSLNRLSEFCNAWGVRGQLVKN